MKESLLACLLLLAAQASQAAVISYTSDPFFFLHAESAEVASGVFFGGERPPRPANRLQRTRLGLAGFDESLGTLNSVTIAFDSVLTSFSSIFARRDFPDPFQTRIVGNGASASSSTQLFAEVDFEDVFASQTGTGFQASGCFTVVEPRLSCSGFGTAREDFGFVLETVDDLDAFLLSNLTDGMFFADLTYFFRPGGTCTFRNFLRRGLNCTIENGGIWEGGATITYDYDPFSVPAPDPTGPFALVLLAGLCAARQRRRTPCR